MVLGLGSFTANTRACLCVPPAGELLCAAYVWFYACGVCVWLGVYVLCYWFGVSIYICLGLNV